MAELLDERVGEIDPVQVAEVKEQLHQQLGQVEAQLAAQKKVSKGWEVEWLSTGSQENETHLDELNNMVEERLVELQRGLTDQIDGVTGRIFWS